MAGKTCPFCGSQNPESVQNCLGCQRSLTVGGGATRPPHRKSNFPFAPVILLLIVGGAALWWFVLRSPEPEEVVQRYYSALQAGNVDGMTAYISTSSLQTPECKKALQAIAARAGGADPDAEKPTLTVHSTDLEDAEGKIAVVSFETSDTPADSSGVVPRAEYVLVNEDGRWKIDTIETARRVRAKVAAYKERLERARQRARPVGG